MLNSKFYVTISQIGIIPYGTVVAAQVGKSVLLHDVDGDELGSITIEVADKCLKPASKLMWVDNESRYPAKFIPTKRFIRDHTPILSVIVLKNDEQVPFTVEGSTIKLL